MNRLLTMATLLAALAGCDAISPFVGEELKDAMCDRDVDGLARPGWCGGDDCDDGDAGVSAATSWYRDVDRDTFGAGEAQASCTQPDGYVARALDCDDTDEFVNPDAIEVCDGIDNDCDGGVDDENLPVWYADKDQDGWGHEAASIAQCDQPDGHVDNGADCDDGDAASYPGAQEVCDDLIDQDCNGLVDDAQDAARWNADADDDGWGDPDVSVYSCAVQVDGYVLNNQDCDDADFHVSPTASEACEDGIDNDCDGTVDTDAVDTDWYRDADGDGWGDAAVSVIDCAPPEGYIGNAADCDDTRALVNPTQAEVCGNGLDDNCDEGSLECRFNGSYNVADEASLWIVADAGQFGNALAFADFNDDDLDDVAVGAYQDSANGSNAGSVRFFWGPLTQTGELGADAYDARILGDAASQFGRDTVMVGDVSGDGVDDLAVGAIGNDRVYVFFLPLVGDELVAADADVIVSGLAAGSCGTTPGSGQGFAIGGGDLNDDGETDLAVGGCDSNAVGVFWGPLSQGSTDLSLAGAAFTGTTQWDRFGYSLAVGDFSGDAVADLAVGAPEGSNNAGNVRLYFGPLVSGSAPNLTLVGGGNDRYGSQAFAADLNDDAADDLLTSSRQVNGVRLTWGDSLSQGGIGTSTWNALCGAGEDLDGDGIADLLVAQRQAGGYTCGDASCVTLVYGSTSILATAVTWYLDAEVPTVGAGAPELNGDTYPDILIGAASQNTVWLIPGLGM